MKIIMTGGGTGGHIYPAIAIADKIKEKYPSSEILFVGTERGLESTIVPKSGYDIRYITVSGFSRKNLLKNVGTAINLLKGTLQSARIINDFKPDIVIGTGGYVSAPVVRTAARMGVQTYIHEQNTFPGVTNKLLEKYVDKVFLAFPEAEKYFKDKKKLVVTGNPVREAFKNIENEKARALLSIPRDKFVILSFGGSGGAKRINEAVLPLLDLAVDKKDTYVILATGNRYYKDVKETLKQKNILSNENIRILEYIEDMPNYLAAADLVISRSGALTISEIIACGKAAILIPSPNVTGNHQFHNAKAIADKGGAILIEEAALSDEILVSSVMSVMYDKEKQKEMESASRAMASTDALVKIAEYM
ncbi:MAG: undecaprenyldiphospho-muramoylpentapeptide beta-N-acetylglucosaminyltransferase [Eubacteriales bacterium]|nr:undecaprenyldiphospho-muramoylpentapeptide beta-N-acetylglucosaminyltransferase [Eubacteriales bacterium]MDD4389890.1 undecaprenyldiphospho-muramoylpentapeptide beta-N-acetylglucosaminyltransferase [Eubacteriales bacterium]